MSNADIARCDVPTLARRLDAVAAGEDDVLLLDVRESWERQIAAIDPSMAVVMNDVPDHLDEIRTAQAGRDLIVFCHTGKRSLVIAKYLVSEGFEQVISLDGGIDAWSEHIRAPRHQY